MRTRPNAPGKRPLHLPASGKPHSRCEETLGCHSVPAVFARCQVCIQGAACIGWNPLQHIAPEQFLIAGPVLLCPGGHRIAFRRICPRDFLHWYFLDLAVSALANPIATAIRSIDISSQ